MIRKIIMAFTVLLLLATPAAAMEITAPDVPDSAKEYLPDAPETFAEGLMTVLTEAVKKLQPAIAEAAGVCVCVVAVVILISVVQALPGSSERVVRLVGVLAITALLLQPSHSLIHLGTHTVQELSEYGKLLLPVMTAAVAAQGGTTTSAALYTGTAFFDTLLSTMISSLIIPMIYIFLCLSAANCAAGEEPLGKLKDFVKWLMTWSLKTVLYVFTGYIGITGVISGTTDAVAVKATKLTISGMVPVVGSILSDASETVLVSAGVVKNAAGIYGVLAILAVWIGPFVQIGVQYLLLKLTASVCDVFGSKQVVKLVHDFSRGMGLLLAMTSTVCMLLLISTVCFMKGMG